MEDTPTSLIASKRWKAALAGIATLSGLTAPALGIPADVLPWLLCCSTAILVAVIIGQTVTDVATGGATSGNYRAKRTPGAAPATAKPEAGFLALPAAMILAAFLVLGSASCSTLGDVAKSEEKVAVLTEELADVRAQHDQAGAAVAQAEVSLKSLQDTATALAAELAAAETPTEQANVQARLDALEPSLAKAQAAYSEAAANYDLSQAELNSYAAQLEGALRSRQAAGEAAAGQVNAASAAGGMLLPGAGGLIGTLGMLALGAAQAWGESRSLKRRKTVVV